MESTIIALIPPVSAMNGTIGPLIRERALDGMGDLDGAGEDDAGGIAVRDKRRSNVAVAGNELERRLGYAGLEQQANRFVGDERRLFRRLGDHGIARDERGDNLSEKNRERKIPWRNAHEDAAPMATQAVVLAGWTRHRRLHANQARLRGVIAAQVRRLANLRERVVEGLSGFALQQRDEPAAPRLDQIGRAFERRRSGLDRRRAP